MEESKDDLGHIAWPRDLTREIIKHLDRENFSEIFSLSLRFANPLPILYSHKAQCYDMEALIDIKIRQPAGALTYVRKIKFQRRLGKEGYYVSLRGIQLNNEKLVLMDAEGTRIENFLVLDGIYLVPIKQTMEIINKNDNAGAALEELMKQPWAKEGGDRFWGELSSIIAK